MPDATGGETVREIDTTDIDRWVGVPLPGLDLRYPVTDADIGRWAQSMHNPNHLYFDPDYAAQSRFGRIVAPQSFTVAMGDGHGAQQAVQGKVPGTHMLFGGDEWWFYGPRIYAGDLMRCDRMLFDYRVTQTSFAGPTIFSRGDCSYVNNRGEWIAKQRSTAIRYFVEEANKRGTFDDDAEEPSWSQADLDLIEEERLAYYLTFQRRGHEPRPFDEVRIGDELPTRAIGPHSAATFATEHRARAATVWGAAFYAPGRTSLWDAGWIGEMGRDFDKAAIDPSFNDGLYQGASRGHVSPDLAKKIGVPRGYGYGSSIGGWVLDYVENWAGEWAQARHSKVRYSHPAFVGDATYLDATVKNTRVDDRSGRRFVVVDVRMRNQQGRSMASGTVDVEFLR